MWQLFSSKAVTHSCFFPTAYSNYRERIIYNRIKLQHVINAIKLNADIVQIWKGIFWCSVHQKLLKQLFLAKKRFDTSL